MSSDRNLAAAKTAQVKQGKKPLPATLTLKWVGNGYLVPANMLEHIALPSNPLIEEAGLTQILTKMPGQEKTSYGLTRGSIEFVPSGKQQILAVNRAETIISSQRKAQNRLEKADDIRKALLGAQKSDTDVRNIKPDDRFATVLLEQTKVASDLAKTRIQIEQNISDDPFRERMKAGLLHAIDTIETVLEGFVVSLGRGKLDKADTLKARMLEAGIPGMLRAKLTDHKIWDSRLPLIDRIFPKKMDKHMAISLEELKTPAVLEMLKPFLDWDILGELAKLVKTDDYLAITEGVELKPDGTPDVSGKNYAALMAAKINLPPYGDWKKRMSYYTHPISYPNPDSVGATTIRGISSWYNIHCGFTPMGIKPKVFFEQTFSLVLEDQIGTPMRAQAAEKTFDPATWGDSKAEKDKISEMYLAHFRAKSKKDLNTFLELKRKTPFNASRVNPIPTPEMKVNGLKSLYEIVSKDRWNDFLKTEAAARVVAMPPEEEVMEKESKMNDPLKSRSRAPLGREAKRAMQAVVASKKFKVLKNRILFYFTSFEDEGIQAVAAKRIRAALDAHDEYLEESETGYGSDYDYSDED
jgi:hypothetical protein